MNSQVVQAEVDSIQKVLQEKHHLNKVTLTPTKCHSCGEKIRIGISFDFKGLTLKFCNKKELDTWKQKYKIKKQ